ncbi:MAG: hypothetical protein QXG97_02915 [Nitrososphaerota archaeon]
MGSVTLTHVIGTVGLMVVFFAVSSYYSISYASLQFQVIALNLEKVSNYVASNVVDTISLCYMTETNQVIYKKLEIPAKIGVYGYNVTILQIAGEENFKVRSYLVSRPAIYGESTLPWSTSGLIGIYNGTDLGIDDLSFDPEISVSSGLSNIVVWCSKLGDDILIGLGIMR